MAMMKNPLNFLLRYNMVSEVYLKQLRRPTTKAATKAAERPVDSAAVALAIFFFYFFFLITLKSLFSSEVIFLAGLQLRQLRRPNGSCKKQLAQIRQ